MNDFNTWLAVAVGILLRLAIPIFITALVVFFLRRLDEDWRAESKARAPRVRKPKCWEIRGCTPEERADCEAAASPLPCWQYKRLPNGYLRDECLDCEVFIGTSVTKKMSAPKHA